MKARQLVAALGVVIVLFLTRPMAAADLLSPFVFHGEGEPPLLLLRCGALFFSLYALRRAWPQALIVIALFSLSMIMRGALYPFVLVTADVVARSRESERAPDAVLYGALAGALALCGLARLKHPEKLPDERDPAQMVAHWQARRNLYEARWWALAWTRREATDHGEGYLALAGIDWELGRDVQARKVLAKVIDGPSSEASRERARALRAQWNAQRPEAP